MMNPDEIRWSTWAVPNDLAWNYVVLMAIVLYLLPYWFGLRLTALGFAFNFFWADFIFYRWYKTKLMAKQFQKEYERYMKWRRDNGEEDEDEDERR
jgi:hypothetical protein|tara:strand:- start:136 stop:423 length:288 start_codon:yes stop_codon:yes gene_type:complete